MSTGVLLALGIDCCSPHLNFADDRLHCSLQANIAGMVKGACQMRSVLVELGVAFGSLPNLAGLAGCVEGSSLMMFMLSLPRKIWD